MAYDKITISFNVIHIFFKSFILVKYDNTKRSSLFSFLKRTRTDIKFQINSKIKYLKQERKEYSLYKIPVIRGLSYCALRRTNRFQQTLNTNRILCIFNTYLHK